MATSGTTTQRILVVDDEPLICAFIRRILAVDGHQVETPSSGEAALGLFGKDVWHGNSPIKAATFLNKSPVFSWRTVTGRV
jgi:hypothetical protein